MREGRSKVRCVVTKSAARKCPSMTGTTTDNHRQPQNLPSPTGIRKRHVTRTQRSKDRAREGLELKGTCNDEFSAREVP
eukprot:592435-Pleurochrysis_carterae.AAC.2